MDSESSIYYPQSVQAVVPRYRGGALIGVICSTRITVTLSVFIFRTYFFAQIVENREAQLSSHFLGAGDNFSKSYDENQIWSKWVYARAGLMRRSLVPYSCWCHTNLFSS